MSKLTKWFSLGIKPCRVGIYEIKIDSMPIRTAHYSYWDGRVWSYFARTPKQVVASGYVKHCHSKNHACSKFTWRGLTKESK